MSSKRLLGFIGIGLFVFFTITGRKRVLAPSLDTKIKGVPLYHQYPDLPTGCEATSLAMLLSWASSEPVSKYEVADALPKGSKVKMVNGKWKGTHPNKAFVGNPYTDSDDGSFGVFEGPILETIETFMPDKGVNLTGQSFEAILAIIRSGKPVMAWTTLEQRETFYGKTWTDDHGDGVDWYENEHAVVLTGIEGDHVVAHDPHTGKAEYYNRELFVQNWRSMGGRAVTLVV
ncbi:C39 family peptidase [Lentibacillus salicampi]|uniref:Peptidase C39-like domain-containing protein n=1 Tax=Lentibacillus salicampi TaxID=175306 RepID=A0A4Y9A794_9BACI|nr:C39 family peptidase [Lentibacillus salicampi]TFJ91573.1 hypothetical protein E4U82_16960 [Lentibacillus salicampi]